jgi:hypothetical protein
MSSHLELTRTWSDDDLIQVTFVVCDGVSTFTNEAYVPLDWGTVTAKALHAFGRQVHGGLFDLQAGDEGPEYASGSIRARFHWYKPDQLLISTRQQGSYFPFKGSTTAPEARLFLRTEAALLDRFVASLPALDVRGGETISLECVELAR